MPSEASDFAGAYENGGTVQVSAEGLPESATATGATFPRGEALARLLDYGAADPTTSGGLLRCRNQPPKSGDTTAAPSIKTIAPLTSTPFWRELTMICTFATSYEN